jgi:uncharacterized protein (UPF0264 family)
MTQLLISVTNIEEAKIALENGADIIDLKDPNLGALGALPIDRISSIVTYVNNQKQVNVRTSATIGDLPMEPDLIHQHVARLIDTKVDFIKIGFFDCVNYQPFLDSMQRLTQSGAKLIAVLFAESTYPIELIGSINQAGFIGVMIDTAIKNGQTLMDHYSKAQLKKTAQKVFNYHLSFGLAGSLKLQHVVLLKEINATYIGFRGGVCDANQRNLALDAIKINAIRKTM